MTVIDGFERAERLGLLHATAEDERLDGRIVTVNGTRMVNFGSCGYTGLETHPSLKAAVIEAVQRYGTQFSATRAYVSSPDYPATEAALSELFGRPALVTSSTSMANMAAICTLTTDRDLILIDAQAHRSVQMATMIARGQGSEVQVVPHSNIAALSRKLTEAAGRYRRVWYLADGLYSMFGDFAPIDGLNRLVAEHPDLWLLLDDAHSVSWTGTHGRGHVLEHLSRSALDRTVVTASLNKSFGAAGGAIAFPDQAMRDQVFSYGWPMIFSGPVQPPMLAAIRASAELHLSGEIIGRQTRLRDAIRFFNTEAARRGLPLVFENETPIRYVAAGDTASAINLAERLQKAGFLVNCASYPAVPPKRSGIRVALTLHQRKEDIIGLVESIAESLPRALADEDISSAELVRGFHREFAGREVTLREVGAW
ncbi:7-keto-8-aminopelargonate synthetase [Amycolatopsis xylanica]|uniref:8-amino-7-oxononanoate synthase n=1 Tax=Amycolatopsis xylanica TaxID=589385 RepID=A0A1H3G372_9PSEU|nr:aminotransferase class I/II-fold pyridoxal phosphate-dependent enzyme [Amycolatopsis xylanica]SDX97711.1 7-keto-8-aminopelargonate synthetase [Amycolatopsis xylanica]